MNIDLTVFAASVHSGYTWLVLAIALVSGIVGGLSHKLRALPDDTTPLLVYIVVGGVASLAVLYVFSPQDCIKLIALSIAAGYGGKAVLDAMEARIKTALAQQDAARAKEAGQATVDAGKEAVTLAKGLAAKSDALEKALIKAKGQSRAAVMESLQSEIPSEAWTSVSEPTTPITEKLDELASKLDYLEGSFAKKQ